ncbi:MAG: fibronectin type III domain-containing protein [Terriglobia bacterium]
MIRLSVTRRASYPRRPPFGAAIRSSLFAPRSSQASLAATLVACALCLAGCATEGPPHPPRIQRPEAVRDLVVTQVGRTLVLTFHPPDHAVDGRRLTKPIEVQFFRRIRQPGKPTPGAFVAVKPWADLTPADVPHFEHGGVIQYAATLTPAEFQESAGKTFEFMVRTLTRGFRRRPFQSDPSNVAVTRLIDVSESVEGLRAYPSQEAVELKWTAPTLTLTGKPVQGITGYRIFRSAGGKPGTFAVIGKSAATSYADKNFVFGHTYYYTVRAVFGATEAVAQSADSAPAVLTPRDIFPPHVPQSLTAIYTGRAVELVWTPNLEPDLAGYNIYRREDAQAPQKLNPSLQNTAIYRDLTAEAGHQYSYWVTAVDRSGNESDPSAAVSVEAR